MMKINHSNHLNILLDRDSFRSSILTRDNYRCIICHKPTKNVHHIVEGGLFDDGGYYIDNGVSLCETHHLEAEMTILTCNELRLKGKIENVILPSHLYHDEQYDKWGNIILDDNRRIKGELFFDSSVQQMLKEGDVLNQFLQYVKYPRTYHLEFSEFTSKDDRMIGSSDELFSGKRVIVTTKMDGENATLYSNGYCHARSIESKDHPARHWLKNFHHNYLVGNIPEGWRLCGENMFLTHSIHYRRLRSYFYLLSIFDEYNNCLSWDETTEWGKLLDLQVVPVLYDDIWSKDKVIKLNNNLDEYKDEMEGYVVRVANGFNYSQFRSSVAKFVRKDHNKCNEATMRGHIVKNELNRGCLFFI